MPQMDYSKLRGRIRECGRTQREVAEFANMANTTFNLKLNGKYAFSQREIQAILKFLKIPPEEIGNYFFTPKV